MPSITNGTGKPANGDGTLQAKHIIVGHTIFKDISTFYDGKVIGVNVDNKENQKKKRGRALLIDKDTYFVVGDKGVLRKL